MYYEIDKSMCILCMRCIDDCPHNAIGFGTGVAMYNPPVIYADKCKLCGKCHEECMSNAIKLINL